MGVGEEGTGEVADGGYDDSEVVAAVPEAVVGRLVAEDLGILLVRRKVDLISVIRKRRAYEH